MDPYSSILTKHSELSTIIAKIAAENRAATAEETKQLDTLKSEIETIRKDFESEGRKRFAANLDRESRKDGITLLKKGDSLEKHYRPHCPEEHAELNLGKLLKGFVSGDWVGADLERKAAGEGSAAAGGIFIPTLVSARVIDLARNVARVFQAGAQTIPMDNANLTVPRLTQDATGAWTAEGTDITAADGTFDGVVFTAHKLGVILAINNELLEDAPNAGATLENSIARAAALALDAAALIGSGVGSTPKGLLLQTGVTITDYAGAAPANYDSIAAQAQTVRGYNFEPNAVLWNARTQTKYRNLKDGLNQPMRPQSTLDGLDFLTTQQIPTGTAGSPVVDAANVYVGQWDQLAFGMRAGMRIEVSREASYMGGSPVTLNSAFSKDQTIFRLVIRGDWQPLHPTAFAIAKDIAV